MTFRSLTGKDVEGCAVDVRSCISTMAWSATRDLGVPPIVSSFVDEICSLLGDNICRDA